MRREHEAIESACRDTIAAVGDAIRRAERADAVAVADRRDFDRLHAWRRDVAHRRLDADLARMSADVHAAAARIASRLCSAHEAAGTERLATLLGLDLLARPESAARIRELVDGADFSPLTTDEMTERREAARPHRETITTAVRVVREAACEVGVAARALSAGQTPADSTLAAADAVDAADRAAAAARAHRAALAGENTEDTTTTTTRETS